MKRKIKISTILLVFIAIGISALLFMQSRPSSQPSDQSGNPLQDITFEAVKETMTDVIEVKGKSAYVGETIVYAPFQANITRWLVEEGQQVNKGDILFELDAEKEQHDAELAEARIKAQQLELKLLEIASKNEETTEGDALQRYAKKEQQEMQTRLKTLELDIAQKVLADQKQRLANSRYPSPESGIFLFTGTKRPLQAARDEPIGKIVDLSELQLVTEVSEFEVFRIQEGMEVEVRIDAIRNEVLAGTVTSVSKFAKPSSDASGSARFEVTISLQQHPDLIAGLSLTGKIITNRKENAIVIPTITIMYENNANYVYIQNEDGIERREIKLGLETAEKTEVLEGIQEGEILVLR